MWSRRFIIHFSAVDFARLNSSIKCRSGIRKIADLNHSSIKDLNHACVRIFSNLELNTILDLIKLCLWIIARTKAINQIIHIKLDHVAITTDSIMTISFHLRFETIKFFNSSRNYTWLFSRTLHGIGFSTACLTIGENANIVTV